MKISTEIGSAAKIIGEEKAVEYVAKAGFDAWDFSMTTNMCKYNWGKKTVEPTGHPLGGSDYLAYARKLKQIGLDNGIVCNQSHAPFPVSSPEIHSYLKRVIECTAEAGGDICVIHPDNDLSATENADMYLELLPFAKDCGVKLATENMWNWDKVSDKAIFAACATPESFCEHVDMVNSDYMIACLDIGHAEMMGDEVSAVAMIEALDHRLQALHIHDNDRHNDSHMLPFTMDIDFVPIIKALKKINYQGYFTLEVNKYLNGFTDENILEGLTDMALSAKKLVRMFDAAE